MVKKTALHSQHLKLNARMVPFGGYDMPVEYEGVTAEHMAVRNKVGLFDVSHMGEFYVTGINALEFLQKTTTNDVSKLVPGKIQYSCMPNGKGGIVDDLLVYMFAENEYMLVVNASNIEKDWEWLKNQNTFQTSLKNASDAFSLLALQGPNAANLLQRLTPMDLGRIPYYSFSRNSVAGIEDVIISATGYTGAGGFELYVPNEKASLLWEKIMENGDEYGLKPAGLAARDTLRLEMGFCLYGNDIDDTTSPIEAGLGWITKFTPEKDFIDKDKLQAQKLKKPSRKLIGFVLRERGIPRHGYRIVDGNNNEIGHVTSGTMSPVLKKGIGMGYVKTDFALPETSIGIEIRNKIVPAEIVRPPFVKKD